MIKSFKFIIANTLYLADAPGEGEKPMLSNFFREVRLALRGIARRPGFAAAVIGTLALGVGANTAIFTVVRALLLRSLPYAQAERLVAVHYLEPGSDQPAVSDRRLLRHRRGQSQLRRARGATAAGARTSRASTSRSRCRRSGPPAGFSTSSACGPRSGARPGPKRKSRAPARVVLLGDGLWRSRFGADPAILGKVLTLNGEPYEVIGVLPPDFLFLGVGAQLVSPLVLETDPRRARRSSAFMRVVGRLRPGVGPDAAKQDLDAIVARLRAAYPDTNAGRSGVRLQPLAELVIGNYRTHAPRPPGRRRARSPDRLHQPGQPVARPPREPPSGAGSARGPRSAAARPRPPAPDGDRRCSRFSGGCSASASPTEA